MIPEINRNYSLHLVTDKVAAGRRPLAHIVQEAVKGGATIIQYREKDASTHEMICEARRLHAITMKAGVPLIVNDRVDVALAMNAEGVHLGQEDMPACIARRLLGPEKIIGVSVKTVEEAQQAVADGADYLGIGPIFGTKTKKDAGEPIGLDAIKNIAQAVSIPLVAIGGITLENVREVIASGANGVAVISAIVGQSNPQEKTEQFIANIESAKNS